MSTIELAIIGQILLWLVLIGVYLASGQASVFHPLGIYLGFHGLVFILRPILVHYYGFNSVWLYMGLEPDPEVFVRTLAVSSLGLAVLATTCLSIGRVRPVFPSGMAPSLSREQNDALVVMTIIFLPWIAYSIFRAGGDTGGVMNANGVYTLTKTTGYVVDAQFMLAPLLCLWLVKTRFHWLNLAPILFYVAYRTWCGWARWTIVLFFITIVFQYCWYHRSRWLPAWTIVAAIPVLILFNMLGHNRGVLQDYFKHGTFDVEQYNHTIGMSAADDRKEKLDTQDFANFDYLAAVISVVPSRTGMYTYGSQYLQLFTEPIPRILWKGKPIGAPVALFSMNHYANFTGLTFSLVGDGWSSGGWIGVIITLGLAGFVLGLAHRSFWTNASVPIPSMLYITFLGITPNWFRDGGISVFKFLLFTWLPILALPIITWFLNGRLVPGNSILLQRGERLRIVQAGSNHPPMVLETTSLNRTKQG